MQSDSTLNVRRVPLRDLLEHPHQPRFDDGEEIEALKASIQEEGVLNPPIVVHHPKQGGKFSIVAGHRRVRAMRELGWQYADVVVNERISGDALAPLVENVVKKDLVFIEYAKSIAGVYNSAEEGSLSFTDIGRMIGKDRNFVSRAVSVGSLPSDLVKKLYDYRQYRFANSDKIMGKIADCFRNRGKSPASKLIEKLREKEEKDGFSRDLFLEIARLEASLTACAAPDEAAAKTEEAAGDEEGGAWMEASEPEDPFAEFEEQEHSPAVDAAPDCGTEPGGEEEPGRSPETVRQAAGFRYVDDGDRITVSVSRSKLTAASAADLTFLLRKLIAEIQ